MPNENHFEAYDDSNTYVRPYPSSRLYTTPYAASCRHCLPTAACQRLVGFAYAEAAQWQANQCGYNAYTGEVFICCPPPAPVDLRYRRDDFRRRQQHQRRYVDYDDDNTNDGYRASTTDKPWVWDSQPIAGTRFSHWDTFAYSAGLHRHHQTRHSHHYDVPDNAIDVYHSEQQSRHSAATLQSSGAWLFDFEDPQTTLNCPPSISADFEVPDQLLAEAVPPVSVPAQQPSVAAAAMADDVAAPAAPETTQRPQELLLNGPNCGVSISTRIIGGENAGPGQFPWMARLAYRNRSESDNYNLITTGY